MWCRKCNMETSERICPVCSSATVEDLPTEIFWCKECQAPIAFLEDNNTIGMFHEKVGLMYDKDSNIIAFSGSMNESVIIICPYQHLVEQWKEDIVAFGMKPIVCYSASSQKNWRERLKTAVSSFNLGVQKHFCMVSTNATFSIEYVQNLMTKLHGNVVLVVDEAHNFGAENLSKTLLPHIPYRLALSATIDRHGDPEGTQKLYDYFGEKCIEYTLKDAIDNDMLTPYYYHPVPVSLNDDELSNYLDLTNKIIKNIHADKNGKIILSEYAKMLLIKRARIVAGAADKIRTLRKLMDTLVVNGQSLIIKVL